MRYAQSSVTSPRPCLPSVSKWKTCPLFIRSRQAKALSTTSGICNNFRSWRAGEEQVETALTLKQSPPPTSKQVSRHSFPLLYIGEIHLYKDVNTFYVLFWSHILNASCWIKSVQGTSPDTHFTSKCFNRLIISTNIKGCR